MLTSDILYLKTTNHTTIIKKSLQNEFKVDIDIYDLFDKYLLKYLTTYKGRVDATSKVYHIKKNIPVYLDYNLVFIQIFNKKQYNNIYINICKIIDMIKDKDNTIIVFDDGSKIIIDKPYHILKKYYNNSLKINLINFRKE